MTSLIVFASVCGPIPGWSERAISCPLHLLDYITYCFTDPGALREPRAHIDRYMPRRAQYARLWQEVKAS